MACQGNKNRTVLAATRCGITTTASNLAYFAGVATQEAAKAAVLGAAVGAAIGYCAGGDIERSAVGSATMSAAATFGGVAGATITGGGLGQMAGYIGGAVVGFKQRENAYAAYRMGKSVALRFLAR